MEQPPQFWQGNLPCVSSPTSGCLMHNPHRSAVFFNPQLPASNKPSLSTLFKRKSTAANADSSTASTSRPASNAPVAPVAPILSPLPLRAEFVDPLPLVHPSVRYSLAFYHVHAATVPRRTSQPSCASILPSLTCHGTAGSHPQISYAVTPLLSSPPESPRGAALLVQHHYVFAIELDHVPPPDTSLRCEDHLLRHPSYGCFAPCPHMTRLFKGYKDRRHSGMRYVSVSYSLKNVLGQEFSGAWRSEVGQQPQNFSCGMCFTEIATTFQLKGSAVVVNVWVHKDLGAGEDPFEPRWIAARRGTEVRRDRSDFGRIRRTFAAAERMDPAVKSGEKAEAAKQA